MSRRNFHGIVPVAISTLFLSGCGILDPSESEQLPDPSYIDEPIILEISEPISYALPPEGGAGDYVFRMGQDTLVKSSDFNDFLVRYDTPSSCDEDAWVYSYRESAWKQIGFHKRDYPLIDCAPAGTQQDHLLSARGIDARDCLSDNNSLTLRGDRIDDPRVTAVRRNDRYYALPASDISSIAWGDGVLWASTFHSRLLYTITLSGIRREAAFVPVEYASAVAFGEGDLWFANRGGLVIRTATEGMLRCSFYFGETGFPEFTPGIEWSDDALWYAHFQGSQVMISQLQPEASCLSGEPAVLSTFSMRIASEFSWNASYGLAWDGSHLLVASDSLLYEVTPGGSVVTEYPMPVKYVRDMAWDGETVWMLCSGPKGIEGGGPVIARFKLR